MKYNLVRVIVVFIILYIAIIPTCVNAETNIIQKNNLTYCINYFYDGIISINDTECFYDGVYGEEITTFVDKPREGYILDSFDRITLLDIEENIMKVKYKSNYIGKMSNIVFNNSIDSNTIKNYFIRLFRAFIKSILH